jgi:hypothetical protein
MYQIKQSTAITIPFFVHDASGDAVTGLSDGSFTKRISKNGAAFGAMTVTITEMENGWYSIPLSTSHSDTLGLLSITFTNAGAKQVNLQWRVEAKLVDDLNDISTAQVNTECDTALTDYDGPTNAEMIARTLLTADYFDSAVDTVANVTTVATLTGHTAQTGDSFVRLGAPAGVSVSADILVIDNFVDGIESTLGVAGAGLTDITLNAASIDLVWDETLTGHTTADTTGLLLNEWQDGGRLDLILDARMAESSINTTGGAVDTVTTITNQVTANVTAISGDSTAADNLEASLETIIASTATGVPTTTTMSDSSLTETTDNHFNGRVIIWRTGGSTFQATDVTAYDGTTKTFTFTATVSASVAGDAYVLV